MAVTNIFGRDFYQGLAADMAACVPRVEGALFWATDTLILYCWSGAAWNTVGAGTGGNVATDAIWDAKGDLAAGTGANTASKVAVGTDGKYLKADSGAAAGVSWDTPAGSVATDAIWDAKGDLAVGTGANTAQKLSVGANNTILMAASGETTGAKWSGALSSWTPTVTQSGAVVVTVDYAKYWVIGSLYYVTAYLTVTGSGTSGNDIIVGNLPATPANNGCYGTCMFIDQGTGYYVGGVIYLGGAGFQFRGHLETNDIGSDPAFGLANTDVITFTAIYPA